jgi:EmrB/QacA subfamily drug resistance transporter
MIRFGTPAARWVILATVLGSGIAFLDGTVVNVALPTIGEDLGTGLTGLQWILDGYLVTLSALLLLGGSLGDLYGRRRIFVIGLIGFSLASAGCGLAPDTGMLIAARSVQGATAALLVPGSLAIISASFHPDDRGRAVGAWSGLGGIAGAVGPFLGGWLVDAVNWRFVFFINLPLAAIAVAVTLRHVPESRDPDAVRHLDLPGALLASIGLAAVAYALIEGAVDFGPAEAVAAIVGVAALVAFVVTEARSRQPMLPLEIFRSRQFTGANLTTLAVYTALGGTTFLVVLQLQLGLGYSAVEAGASLLPITVLMLLLSARAGQLAQRTGPRLPMTVGPMVIALGLLLVARVGPGSTYGTDVLPALVVFGLGLACTVAPLTSAVLASVEDRHLGVGSGVNNAVARVAGLLSVALLPALVGLDLSGGGGLGDAFGDAMRVAAGFAAVGGAVAFLTVRTSAEHPPVTQATILQPCHDPCVAEDEAPATTLRPTP